MSASFRGAGIAARLMAAARDMRLLDEAPRQQIYLGDETLCLAQGLVKPQTTAAREISKAQRAE